MQEEEEEGRADFLNIFRLILCLGIRSGFVVFSSRYIILKHSEMFFS